MPSIFTSNYEVHRCSDSFHVIELIAPRVLEGICLNFSKPLIDMNLNYH